MDSGLAEEFVALHRDDLQLVDVVGSVQTRLGVGVVLGCPMAYCRPSVVTFLPCASVRFGRYCQIGRSI